MKNFLDQPYKPVGSCVICSERAGRRFVLKEAPRDRVKQHSRRLSIRPSGLALPLWTRTEILKCSPKRQQPSSKTQSPRSRLMKRPYPISLSLVRKKPQGCPAHLLHQPLPLFNDRSHQTRLPDILTLPNQHLIPQLTGGRRTPQSYLFQHQLFPKVA